MTRLDVIICEDEPYYCLFAGKWLPKSHKSSQSTLAQRQEELEKTEGKDGNEAFIKALPPTFLTVDYEGRVIRMDVSLPTSRLGVWIKSDLKLTSVGRHSPKPRVPDHDWDGSPLLHYSSSDLLELPSPVPKLPLDSSRQ